MALERYFEDIDGHFSKGKGISVFNCREGEAVRFIQRLEDAGRSVRTLRVSEAMRMESFPSIDPAAVGGCALLQDVSVEALSDIIDALIDKAVFPCYFRRKPLFFFSKAGRDEYAVQIHSERIHTDHGQVVNRLLIEQLTNLLDRAVFDAEAPCDAPVQAERTALPVDENLDANQRRAVDHLRGPIRVLAPAGSGKTRTLINRIANLINCGVAPGGILALAFNRKAAEEMAERLQEKGVPVSDRLDGEGVAVRTFHSFGYEIVREQLGWGFDDDSEGAVRRTLRRAVEDVYTIPRRRGSDSLDGFLEALTKTRMELPPIDDVAVAYHTESFPFKPVFLRYLELQRERKFLDFDDMLYLALREMLDSRELRERLQNRFAYILVDEFQDLNRAQVLLMQILALPQNNLFVVGDDDQMIYGWRGAEVTHILSFPGRYAESEDCILSTNYRSSKKIVHHSRWLIDHNLERVEKDIQPGPQASAGVLDIRLSPSLWQQAVEAATWIKGERERQGAGWRDFAVLFRYNMYQFVVALALDREGIPHTPVDSARLFQTAAGRDILSYLRVILRGEKADREDFSRVLKRPYRSLSDEIVDRIAGWEDFLNSPRMEGLEAWQVDRLQDAVDKTLEIGKRIPQDLNSAASAVSAISDAFGLVEFYREQKRQLSNPDDAGGDVLLEVIASVAGCFDDIDGFYAHACGSADGGGDQVRPEEDSGRDEVALTTIHRTKGNEYGSVVYFNLKNEKLADLAAIEEERRVTYVGVTRAIENILITAPEGGFLRFLRELAFNPEFAGLSDTKLERLLSKNRRRQRRSSRRLSSLERKMRSTLERYPELKGDGPPADGSALRDPRAWLRERRLRSAVRRSDLIGHELIPVESLIESAEAEIGYRGVLLGRDEKGPESKVQSRKANTPKIEQG